MTKTQIDEILSKDIIEELGLEALDEDKKIALVEKMSDIVQKRLTLRMVEEMTDEQKDEFEKIADDQSQVAEFLQQVYPNFLEILQEEIAKIKQEMIADFGEK